MPLHSCVEELNGSGNNTKHTVSHNQLNEPRSTLSEKVKILRKPSTLLI